MRRKGWTARWKIVGCWRTSSVEGWERKGGGRAKESRSHKKDADVERERGPAQSQKSGVEKTGKSEPEEAKKSQRANNRPSRGFIRRANGVAIKCGYNCIVNWETVSAMLVAVGKHYLRCLLHIGLGLPRRQGTAWIGQVSTAGANVSYLSYPGLDPHSNIILVTLYALLYLSAFQRRFTALHVEDRDDETSRSIATRRVCSY